MKPVDTTPELLRLRDSSSSTLTSALHDLSARGPDASELASLASRLSLQGIPMTPPSSALPPTRGPSRVPWQLTLTGAAAVGVAAWLLWPAPSTHRSPGALQAQSSNDAPAAGAATSARARRASGDRARPEQASASPAVAEAETGTQPESAAAPAPPELGNREASPSVGRPGTSAVAAGPETVSEPTLRALPARSRASQSPQPTTGEGEAPAGAIAAPSELELLRGARLALKSSPAEALRLTEQHRTSYPSGKLTQERELIAISALVALGHRTAALTRAAGFERTFPTSPYRKQIGELLQ